MHDHVWVPQGGEPTEDVDVRCSLLVCVFTAQCDPQFCSALHTHSLAASTHCKYTFLSVPVHAIHRRVKQRGGASSRALSPAFEERWVRKLRKKDSQVYNKFEAPHHTLEAIQINAGQRKRATRIHCPLVSIVPEGGTYWSYVCISNPLKS
jgi:hypothetical protein